MSTPPPPPFRPLLPGEGTPVPRPPGPPPRRPNWFRRHKVLSIFLGILVIAGFAAAGNEGMSSDEPGGVVAGSTEQSSAGQGDESAAEKKPKFRKPEKHRSQGDDVVSTNWAGQIGIVTFRCPQCAGNTVVQTDGAESLLVNTIGPYSGTRWINASNGSVTTTFTIQATGSWTLTIADLNSIKRQTRAATGSGDDVVYLEAESTKAAISARGSGNFVVMVLSDDGLDLAVNEIGSYNGTVPLSGPALVEVTSEGSWTIDPS